MTEEPTKTCPDCAETILAAARKCRYCGYRFDGRSGAADEARSADGGLLAMLRRPPPADVTGIDLLDSWGVDVADDEGEATVVHGEVAGVLSFIVVTQTRLRVVPARKVRGAREVLEDHFLADLIRVHRSRSRIRRALVAEWRDRRTVFQLDRHQIDRLEAVLAPHAIAGERPDDA